MLKLKLSRNNLFSNICYSICCDLVGCISSILFVKIFHTFLDELNPKPFFININPKGCHYYRIDSIVERGTQNGWNDYSIYSFLFYEQIHFFLVCNNIIPSGFWKCYATFSIKTSSLRDYAVPNVHHCSTRIHIKGTIVSLRNMKLTYSLVHSK